MSLRQLLALTTIGLTSAIGGIEARAQDNPVVVIETSLGTITAELDRANAPISVENFGMGDPLYHDAERLKILVERHLLHTGSAKVQRLLDNWAEELGNFRKVMPRDYQRALKALEDEREQAAMEAAE